MHVFCVRAKAVPAWAGSAGMRGCTVMMSIPRHDMQGSRLNLYQSRYTGPAREILGAQVLSMCIKDGWADGFLGFCSFVRIVLAHTLSYTVFALVKVFV